MATCAWPNAASAVPLLAQGLLDCRVAVALGPDVGDFAARLHVHNDLAAASLAAGDMEPGTISGHDILYHIDCLQDRRLPGLVPIGDALLFDGAFRDIETIGRCGGTEPDGSESDGQPQYERLHDYLLKIDAPRRWASLCRPARAFSHTPSRLVMELGAPSDIAALEIPDLREHGLDVGQDEGAAPPLQLTRFLQQLQFARHRLAPRENAAGDLGMERGRRHDGAAPVGAIRPAQPKQLSEHTVLDIQAAELIDAPIQHAQARRHHRQHPVAAVRVPVHRFAENAGRHAGHRGAGDGDDAGRARLPVDGGKLAEEIARADIAEYHLAAARRGDKGADDAPDHEEDVRAAFPAVENLLLGLIPAPEALLVEAANLVIRQAAEERNVPQRIQLPRHNALFPGGNTHDRDRHFLMIGRTRFLVIVAQSFKGGAATGTAFADRGAI